MCLPGVGVSYTPIHPRVLLLHLRETAHNFLVSVPEVRKSLESVGPGGLRGSNRL